MGKLDLLKTLRDALEFAAEFGGCEGGRKDREALSLLSTPDALAWRLLEEMAEERVEVETEREIHSRSSLVAWTEAQIRVGEHVYVEVLGEPRMAKEDPSLSGRLMILCLARAIKEQESRESEVGELFTCRRCRRRFPTMEGSICPSCEVGDE